MRNEIISLTSIRGIAAIWVAIYHFIAPINRDVACLSCHIPQLDKAYLSVDLFFILSGFIMSHVYLDMFSNNALPPQKKQAYFKFIYSRISRIYPLHIFTLFCFVIWFFIASNIYNDYQVNDRNNIETFFYNLFLIHAWGIWNDVTWNYPSWSISAEFFAYLAFPFIVSLVSKKYAIPYIILTTALILIKPDSLEIGHGGAIYRCLSEFTLGILGYIIYLKHYDKISFIENNIIQVSLFLLVLILPLFNNTDSIIIIIFLPLILSISRDNGLCANILKLKFFYFLGKISFSIYLTHAFILAVYRNIRVKELNMPNSLGIANEMLILLFLCIITILISWVTYSLIEDKLRKRLNSLYIK